MSDTNRTALLYIPESVFGVTPSTPNMKFVRHTGESLGLDTQTTRSNEIRSDRQIPDFVRTGINAAGDVNIELSHGAFDDWLVASLMSAGWSTQVSLTGLTLTFNAAAGTITRSAGDWVADGVVVNAWIRPAGAAQSANNAYFKVSAVTTTVITVQQVGATPRMVNEGPTAAMTLKQGSQIVNGTTFTSYAIERRFTDLTNEFSIFNGMAIDQLSLNTQKDGIVTGAFRFLGRTEASAAATAAGSTTAAPTEDVMNAIDDCKMVVENGGAQYDVTALTVQLRNNLRARLQVGTLGAVSMGVGSVEVSGTHQAYYTSKAVMDRYLNYGATSLAQGFYKNGKGYVFDFPRIKYSAGRRVGGGINADVMAEMSWNAMLDPTELITVRVARFS